MRNTGERRWHFLEQGTGNKNHTCGVGVQPEALQHNPPQAHQQDRPPAQHQDPQQLQAQDDEMNSVQLGSSIQDVDTHQDPQELQAQDEQMIQSDGDRSISNIHDVDTQQDPQQLQSQDEQMIQSNGDTSASFFSYWNPWDSLKQSSQQICERCGNPYHGWKLRTFFMNKCWECQNHPDLARHLGRENMDGEEVLQGLRNALTDFVRREVGSTAMQE